MNEIDGAIPKLSFWGEDIRSVTGTIGHLPYDDIAVGILICNVCLLLMMANTETKTGAFICIYNGNRGSKKGKFLSKNQTNLQPHL